MRFIKGDFYADFMRWRGLTFALSSLLVVLSIVAFVYPGANWGVDFAGGTEIQTSFRGRVQVEELRTALRQLGYRSPEVVKVENSPNEFILRVREVSAISQDSRKRMRQSLDRSLADARVVNFKVSPGGDKISIALDRDLEPPQIQEALASGGAKVRSVSRFGQVDDHRYEVQLIGLADQLIERLAQKMGDRGPNPPRRVEWVGPKAGEQLRDAGIQSCLVAIALIMVYVAFRFDFRFAPGAVVAMLHDAIITMGIFVIFRREINLTFIAAVLTVMGYSINDTIVIYDRIRENMHKRRGTSLRELINISTSETLGRTLITGGTTILSLIALYVWGTPVIRDFVLAMLIGILIGTYSSVYTAAPITEWFDHRFFRRQSRAKA